MEKSKLRFVDEQDKEEERENSENEQTEPFDFDEVVRQATTAVIFEDSNASIHHVYFGMKQYTLAVFENSSQIVPPANEISQISKGAKSRKLQANEINNDVSTIQEFYENLMVLQSGEGGFRKNMMKILAAKCVSEQRAEVLLGKQDGDAQSKERRTKTAHNNKSQREVLLVFLESYERSIEDDIAERSLNQNSVICEDHLLENFADMIAYFSLLGMKIIRHLVISGDHMIIYRERLTKILPIFDRNSLETYRKSHILKFQSHLTPSCGRFAAPEKHSSNQRETRSASKIKSMNHDEELKIKTQKEEYSQDSIASRTRRHRREEGKSKILKEPLTCSTIEMEENQVLNQAEAIQTEEDDNHEFDLDFRIHQFNRRRNQSTNNCKRKYKNRKRKVEEIITEEDIKEADEVFDEFLKRIDKEIEEENEKELEKQLEIEFAKIDKQFDEELKRKLEKCDQQCETDDEGNEMESLLELSIIYMRLSSFLTASKFNPQRKNKNFRIIQVIEQLMDSKLSSLFQDIFAEREEPMTYVILLSIVNSYRQLKGTFDITETMDIAELKLLLDGKADIVFNFKDKNLIKLEEISKLLHLNQQWLRNVSSLEIKADLSKIGDEGTFVMVDMLKSIDPLRLQHLIISLRRNSISEYGISAIAEYLSQCNNLKTFRIFFSYNRTRDIGLQAILFSLKNLEFLEVLDLRFFDNQITPEGCKGFEYLKDVKFKYMKYLNISLGNNAIGDEGCRLLSFFLCNIRNVKQLSIFLESNNVSSQGISHLRNVFLRKNQIQYLILHVLSNQIKDEGFIQIINNISKLTTLHSLEIILNENSITEVAGIALGNALKNLIHLTSLILSVRNNKISNKGVNAIGESLKYLKNLESLVLSLTNNTIIDDGGVIIGKNLKYLQKLQKLHLVFYENSINHKSGKAIGEGLRNLSQLNYLILGIGDNNVGDEGAVAIGNCMDILTKVKIFEIYLQNNEVGVNGASAIAKGLRNMKNLKCLVFQIQHSPFGDQPIVELGKSIANLRQLKSLDVYVERCGISEEGGHALGVGLQNLNNIRVMVIDLDSNHIGPMGGKALGLALKSMTGLVDLKLYLKKNNIMPEGGTGLFEGLAYLTKLKSLNIDLYKNYTGDACIALCGKALTHLKELKNLELSITYNSLSQVGTQQFAGFFSQCVSLQEVYLYMQKNSITMEGAEFMGVALGCLKDLQQLKISFGNNQIQDRGIASIIKGAASCQNLKVLYLYAYNIGMTGAGCIAIAEQLLQMKKLERFEFFPSSNGIITFQNGLQQIASAVIKNSETLQNVLVDNPYWEENIRPFITPRIHNQVHSMQVLMYSRLIAPFMHYNPKAIFWDLILDL